MKNATDLKENILLATSELIEQSMGDPSQITARMIAQRAGVGLGLINYHFGSKENLITECVQRIIGNVISGATLNNQYATDRERLTAWATYVFHFLFDHCAVSRISILGDFQHYTQECNSIRTQRGFMCSLTHSVAQEDKPLLTFILTAAMQVAFLGNKAVKGMSGYDFDKKADRAAYIERVVSILFDGVGGAK